MRCTVPSTTAPTSRSAMTTPSSKDETGGSGRAAKRVSHALEASVKTWGKRTISPSSLGPPTVDSIGPMAHARTSMLAASLALLPIALGPGGAAGGPTSLRFVAYDDAAQAGVHFTSLTWNASVADVDGDGREDLLAGRHSQAPAILFRNPA